MAQDYYSDDKFWVWMPQGNRDENFVRNLDTNYLDVLSPKDLHKRYSTINKWYGSGKYAQEYSYTTAKDKAYAGAFSTLTDLLGREPTEKEFAALAPQFYDPSDQGRGMATGRASASIYADQQSRSPEEVKKKTDADKSKYHEPVNKVINDSLGRDATPEELDFFGGKLASGEISNYELGNYIRNTPEYLEQESNKKVEKQKGEDAASLSELSSDWRNYDDELIDRGTKQILSRYAKAGIQNSSALDFAVTDLVEELAKNRNRMLADYSRGDYEFRRGMSLQDYARNKGLSREDYMYGQNRNLENAGYIRSRDDARFDALTGRSWEGTDNYITNQALQNYYRGSGGNQRTNPLTGAIYGAGAMAPTGNPWLIGAGGAAGLFSSFDW